MSNLPKVIVIAGPTASGKSDLAVWLAKKIRGEIISADSRQVFKGMDIGTGKITKKEMQSIPHYLLDIASPKKRFTVTRFQKLANQAINSILKKNKIPIICGGTGFYIQSVIDGLIFPQVKPDLSLRKQLEKQSAKQLFSLLKKKDAKRARIIDKDNKRRLIRALEIAIKTNNPIPELKKQNNFDILFLGIKKDKEELQKRIEKRLLKRLDQGMIKEVKKLKASGISYKKLYDFGLEYRYLSLFLQNKITYQEMVSLLQKEIEKYAKRQITWFKKDKRIIWIKNKKEMLSLVKNFIFF
ncbi:MAG: tRNA (adenosine(37)-N6)-dimethylallyltransferase MiaA [Candidatus Pacebacteria bacterium]|nr:tRNA (adenosine(37)-N6)-dimethylallyltransferase MiaA [Candidatus Paceibacterota bacterium]